MALLIAFISDTGMRLSEALGLAWDYIHLDYEYPHISLIPHPWRPLKTADSKRLIPLVVASLAAVEIMHRHCTKQVLFNSYTNPTPC